MDIIIGLMTDPFPSTAIETVILGTRVEVVDDFTVRYRDVEDSVCGTQIPKNPTPEIECAQYLEYAQMAISCAYRACPDEAYKRELLGLVCELRERAMAFRGEL